MRAKTITIAVTTIVVTFATILLMSNALVSSGVSTLEGFDVFVKAIQSQGTNPQIIKSGSFDFTMTTRRRMPSDSEIKAEMERYEKWFREDFYDDPHLELMIADIPARMDRKYGGEKKIRGKVLLRGNLGEGDSKRLFEIAHYDNANDTWGEPTMVVREDHFGKPNVNVLWEPAARLADLGKDPFTLANFHCFGRIQGNATNLATFSLLDPNRRADFIFSEKNIENLKTALGKLDAVSGNAILRIVGSAEYDDGANAMILETTVNNKISQRYWIDRSRGYVCPLIQYYDDNARLVEEYKSSDYVQHARTGLWYPTIHVETEYDPNTGKMEKQQEFRIDPQTLQLNQSVSDEEFSIDIPAGSDLLDRRNPRSEKRYRAIDKGTLSLAEGGLDLDTMSWLEKVEEGNRNFSLRPAIWDAKRYVLMSVGIVILLIVLFLMRRKRCAKNM